MSACDIICDIICDTGTNVFIPQQQLPLWLPPPCGVSWSPLPFFLPRWHDSAWQPLPPRWTLSWAVPVRSATARDSPRTVCCRSRDPAGCRQMLYQGFCCSWICRESLDGCCPLWTSMKQGMRGAHPSTFATGQMYRQGNRWLLAVSYSMGTPACCMMLFGVRLMGSNTCTRSTVPGLQYLCCTCPLAAALEPL